VSRSKNNVREDLSEDRSKITKFESLNEVAKKNYNSLYMHKVEAMFGNVEDMLNSIMEIITNEESRDLV